jgi:hypothetical protein
MEGVDRSGGFLLLLLFFGFVGIVAAFPRETGEPLRRNRDSSGENDGDRSARDFESARRTGSCGYVALETVLKSGHSVSDVDLFTVDLDIVRFTGRQFSIRFSSRTPELFRNSGLVQSFGTCLARKAAF